MDGGPTAREHAFLLWCLQQPGIAYPQLTWCAPHFLVISPPKTGSTWLAANLRCHPQVFVPDVKEVKYFSSYFKALDWKWYLDHFAPGIDRMRGEASPSYAGLPTERIDWIRRLLPDVKLVFLLRDPVGRAWSHARHNHRYREANFAGCTRDVGSITDPEWCENFSHPWNLVSGDYLGQLRRWLSVFPREQIYVGFYESIAREPERLLRNIFTFLGVDAEVDLAGFPAHERILPGASVEISSSLTGELHRLLHDRTCELADFLRSRLDLEPPPEWQATLACPGPSGDSHPAIRALREREADDAYLTGVLALEEAFPSGHRPVLHDYFGYDILVHRSRLFALAKGCPLDVLHDQDVFRRYQTAGRCLVADSLAEVKEQVDQHVFEQSRREYLQTIDGLRGELQQAREGVVHLEQRLARTDEALGRLEADAIRVAPWLFSLLYLLRAIWNGFRKALSWS